MVRAIPGFNIETWGTLNTQNYAVGDLGARGESENPPFNSQFTRFCHPERSEGSAVRRKMQIPRFARDDIHKTFLISLRADFHHGLLEGECKLLRQFWADWGQQIVSAENRPQSGISGKARSFFFFALIRLLRDPLTPEMLPRLQALNPDLLLAGALASNDPSDSEVACVWWYWITI